MKFLLIEWKACGNIVILDYFTNQQNKICLKSGGIKMNTIGIVLSAVLGVLSLVLTIIILLQSDRAAGFGIGNANAAGNTSYWSKNKGNSMEGALERYTKIGGGLFMLIALVLNFIH